MREAAGRAPPRTFSHKRSAAAVVIVLLLSPLAHAKPPGITFADARTVMEDATRALNAMTFAPCETDYCRRTARLASPPHAAIVAARPAFSALHEATVFGPKRKLKSAQEAAAEPMAAVSGLLPSTR